MFDIIELVSAVWEFLLSAAGIVSLLVILLNFLKSVKVKGVPLVKDGEAGRWFKALQLGTLVILAAVKYYLPDVSLSVLDEFAADLADTYGSLIVILLPFGVRFGELFYRLGVRGIPWLGKSHTEE